MKATPPPIVKSRNAAENRLKRWRQGNKEADKRGRMYGADIRGALWRDNESASYCFYMKAGVSSRTRLAGARWKSAFGNTAPHAAPYLLKSSFFVVFFLRGEWSGAVHGCRVSNETQITQAARSPRGWRQERRSGRRGALPLLLPAGTRRRFPVLHFTSPFLSLSVRTRLRRKRGPVAPKCPPWERFQRGATSTVR